MTMVASTAGEVGDGGGAAAGLRAAGEDGLPGADPDAAAGPGPAERHPTPGHCAEDLHLPGATPAGGLHRRQRGELVYL